MNEKQAKKRIEELRKQTDYYAQKYYPCTDRHHNRLSSE